MSNSRRERCRFRRYQSESAVRSSAVATVAMHTLEARAAHAAQAHPWPIACVTHLSSFPRAERTPYRDELANVVGHVIRGKQESPKIRLVSFAGWHRRGQILDVAGEPLQCLARSGVRREAVGPGFLARWCRVLG